MADVAVRPRHTPWASGTKPFSIAMSPIALEDWIEVDERRLADLGEKAAILAADPDAVRIRPDCARSEAEVRDLVAADLARRGLDPLPVGMPSRLAGGRPVSPLVEAAMMVPDDLVVMRRGEAAWSLAAGVVAFPSAWELREKFDRPMDEIHRSVPGWAGPMATRVARIFDHLAVDAPVWRLNWSIQFGGGLVLAGSKHERPAARTVEAPLVRVERQTLRRLATGDLLFTIKVMVDPVDALARHPDGAHLAASLATQLAGLDPAQLEYKGLVHVRDALVARLGALAA
ncbi:DUF3445 domain-containing protein [Acuticoccus sp. I52.16.1]|uniref:heme-dependent oxidative N-demethylase family protein n=1 Tax=Acuticoccus sp. I52.16.1 TaxID=2928472 RepID=UPI001FD0AA4A|nr:DUF3445 domain-containing protein [Acuticoccus sp. I52.16.1]UOM35929.1 DUF3445 domain-containing protein [Acuticoccus sp. I52.16.1]